MSEDGGAVPPPLILDASVLIAAARGDTGAMALIQGFDSSGRALVIPALAITAAMTDSPGDDAAAIIYGITRLGNAVVAPLQGAGQADRLAQVIRLTGMDALDAHVAAVADASVCPILTLDPAKWRQHAHDLDEPLHFIEIADPEE